MKDIKKKLVKQVKRSRLSLAQEIKDMPMKDFRVLWFVVQQGLKIKKKNRLNYVPPGARTVQVRAPPSKKNKKIRVGPAHMH